ncbi:MAG: hypothetical protein ACTS9Y_16205 [Methylophilus sp.]|uniref:hypothetical protein n=1 Tax=Methylophilus sp. TaxID=29541 RepID=UPI003FA0988F
MTNNMVLLIFLFLSSYPSYSIAEDVIGPNVSIANIVKALKADVQLFQNYSASLPQESKTNACKGNLNFNIESLKVVMKVQSVGGKEGKAGLAIPIGTGAFEPGVNASKRDTNSQILTFTIYPKPGVKSVASNIKKEIKYDSSPIAYTLASLRDNLLDASSVEPCMSFQNPNKDKDVASTFEFGFGVEKKASANAGINLIIFSIGGGKSSLQETTNTITVSFRGFSVEKVGGIEIEGPGALAPP